MPTLVVSDPPHGEVDVEKAAELLGMDVFTARVKVKFPAPEIMWAGGADEAVAFAGGMSSVGFQVGVVSGAEIGRLPWPEPVSFLAFDDAFFRVMAGGERVEVPYDAQVVGVYCRAPGDLPRKPSPNLVQAVASGHGPTIAQAIQSVGQVDLFVVDRGLLRRVCLVPHLFGTDPGDVVRELRRRFKHLDLDERLVGIRPRHRHPGASAEGQAAATRRKGYSFGTLQLRELVGTISPELRDAPQFEIGTRLSYSMRPLAASGVA